MDTPTTAVIDRQGLDELLAELVSRGYRTLGPVVADGAVVTREVTSCVDLPAGWHDEQGPGRYRLHHHDGNGRLFAWAVGPTSPKALFFPPKEVVWRAAAGENGPVPVEVEGDDRAVALVGIRPCEVAALRILDGVLSGGAVTDPGYRARREAAVVVVAECGEPAGTCFCGSMGTGPGCEAGFDLALTEIGRGARWRVVVRSGSALGAELLAGITVEPITGTDEEARHKVLASARARMGRRLEVEGLAAALEAAQEDPGWAAVADRCLSCGNCTLVCPTCFCSDVEDVSDLSGGLERRRRWASCFDLDHSYLHGGAVRPTVQSRYRQWLTHKLSSWWEQFGTSGCVGCGRCITWCPVGIDLTEEATALAAGRRTVP